MSTVKINQTKDIKAMSIACLNFTYLTTSDCNIFCIIKTIAIVTN